VEFVGGSAASLGEQAALGTGLVVGDAAQVVAAAEARVVKVGS
jgi:hypothetical protein